VVEGVSIHERFLDAATAEGLRALSPLVLTWPVNDLERARALVALGVAGLITDAVDRVAPAAA
jgi:glycerophosphoryl diester phosphodiesterase